MPLSADDVVQESSGGSSTPSTNIVISLGSGTTAGNTVIVAFATALTGPTAPAGFVQSHDVHDASTNGMRIYHKSNVGAGETSWTFTIAGASNYAWYAREMSGLDPAAPVDAVGSGSGTGSLTTGATKSTGSSAANPGLRTVQLAFWGIDLGVGAPGTWDSQTNSFTERSDARSTQTGSVTNYGLAVADNYTDGTSGPFECTGTYTGNTLTHCYAGIVVFRAADSPITTPLQYHTGFEFGTHSGIAGGSTSTQPIASGVTGTVGTNVIVQAGSARNGSYGLRIVQSASTAYANFNAAAGATAILPGSQDTLVMGVSVRPQSATGVAVVAEVTPAAGTKAQVVWDSSTSKLGVRWGSGGTVAAQTGTTPANTWAWVTLRVTGLATATWHLDWQCEESGVLTAQSSPADLTGQTASVLSVVVVGGNLSQTMTCDYDDLCLTCLYPLYPLAIHKVQLLTVDTGATPTNVGTVGNFALVTNNATGAALTAGTLTSARDNIDEVPPTISASSDGIVQTATAASDYLEFAMAAPTVAADEIVAGVRLLACMISTTGSGAGSAGIRGYDGTTEIVLVPTTFTWTPGSSTTVSSTVPPWVTKQWDRSNGWTVDALTAAALRFGFSGDATPDMGIHAMYLEVATRSTQTVRMFGVDGDVVVDALTNPHTIGVRSLVTTTPEGKAITLHYEVNTSPTDVPVAAASSDTETPDAPDAPTINYVAIYPDPEGIPDA